MYSYVSPYKIHICHKFAVSCILSVHFLNPNDVLILGIPNTKILIIC